jgi:hypothetical protein
MYVLNDVYLGRGVFAKPNHTYNSYSEKSNKMQQCIEILLFLIFKWSSTCFGQHTAHHQEPKNEQAASGFA